jgi:single-strand DNA-binding protein
MARGINKVILVGTLGKDPEVRYSQSGGAITSVSLATDEKWKDKNGEMQERTEWHRVKFFGRLAEIAGEYLKKGGQCYVEGKLRTEKYTDKQGVERYSTDIIADEMMLLGSKGGGAGAGADRGERSERPQRSGGYGGGERSGSAAPASANRSEEPFPDDDIPF